MSILLVGDEVISAQQDIEQHVLQYFTGLFASKNRCIPNDLIDKVIPLLVSSEDNTTLTAASSLEEVRNAVFSMNSNGTLGPDSFGWCFYKKIWPIIAMDVFNSVSQFFLQGWLLPNLNVNLVVPIPKFPGVDTIENYCPIALANFQFKIITKVMADCLALIAPKILSEN